MTRRPVRIAALLLLAGAFALAAARVLSLEQAIDARREATAATEHVVRALRVALANVRADQIGYVAAGQEPGPWAGRVAEGLAGIGRDLETLRALATDPTAAIAIDAAAGAVASLADLDARALQYAEANQRLLSSDLIFADGFGAVDRALAELELVEAAERAAEREITASLEAERRTILVGAGVFSLLVALALVPVPRPAPPRKAAETEAALAEPPGGIEAGTQASTPAEPAGDAPLVGPRTPTPPAPPVAARERSTDRPLSVDLANAAVLCGELARLVDGRQLPALLGRASALLDAPGLVVWVADRDRRALKPVAAHGYGDTVLVHLAAIPVSADNATAQAFREGRLQTVPSSGADHGAIAAPLLTHAGCVGVVTAEVPGARVDDTDTQALALILTAQLAAVVGAEDAADSNAAEEPTDATVTPAGRAAR